MSDTFLQEHAKKQIKTYEGLIESNYKHIKGALEQNERYMKGIADFEAMVAFYKAALE